MKANNIITSRTELDSVECDQRNIRETVAKADSPLAEWSHHDSSEPVTEGRNYCIKVDYHER